MEPVIITKIIDMDVMIPEQVTKNSDGSYTIFLNARLTHEHRLQSYKHALQHIQNGDFDLDEGNVQEIETVAHTLPTPTTEEAPITVNVNDEKRMKRLAALKRRRQKIKKQLQEVEEDMAFLENMGAGLDTFARGEYRKLYGNDL